MKIGSIGDLIKATRAAICALTSAGDQTRRVTPNGSGDVDSGRCRADYRFDPHCGSSPRHSAAPDQRGRSGLPCVIVSSAMRELPANWPPKSAHNLAKCEAPAPRRYPMRGRLPVATSGRGTRNLTTLFRYSILPFFRVEALSLETTICGISARRSRRMADRCSLFPFEDKLAAALLWG
jgi:hypothetical protein